MGDGRNAQLVRTLRILRDLDRAGGADLYELAERYGTSVRTVRRDLDGLREAGIPVHEEDANGNRKRWRVDPGRHIKHLRQLLETSHYLALSVAMRMPGPAKGASALFASLEELAATIEQALGGSQRKALEQIEACFYSYEKFAYQNAPVDVLWPLVEAIADKRICRVRYRPPRPDGKETRFRILPLRLFCHDRALYLQAHVPRYGDIVLLNLQRLASLDLTSEHGTVPKGYDPAEWENAAFAIYRGKNPVTYRFRFEASVAPYIRERIWHPSQELRELRGGRVELSFKCAESYEVAGWVSHWRDAVEVLEPKSLREELASYGRALEARYGRG